MRTSFGRILLAFALLVSPHAFAAPPRPSLTTVSPSVLAFQFRSALSARGVSASDQASRLTDFQKLPIDLQSTIIEQLPAKSSGVTTAIAHPSAGLGSGGKVRPLAFGISTVSPDPAEAGKWNTALGFHLTKTCTVSIDGTPVPTQYFDCPPDYPQSLSFYIASTVTVSPAEHKLTVTDAATGATGGPFLLSIIAFRGYRGTSGWQFSNFGDSTIPWEMYRDYFGAAAVEDGNHKPLPGAWSYYTYVYKGAGGGGNCYGMSVSSIRFLNQALTSYWKTWFATAPNAFPILYDYPKPSGTQTHQTVQEYQGSWFTQEVLDVHNKLSATQNTWTAFQRATGTGTTKKPVFLLWGSGWGHAVVPYSWQWGTGDDCQLFVYDNNNPYHADETNGPNPNIYHLAWDSGAFTCDYSGVGKIECLSYDEVTPPTPHLPGKKYNGPGSDAVVVSAGPGTNVSQITDEAGHTLFLPNGQINQNPSTRIPLASRVDPLMDFTRGTNGFFTPRVPQNLPAVFVFSQAIGKSLTFTLASGGSATKQLNLFMNGLIFQLQTAGSGKLRAFALLRPTRGFEILSPATLRPISVDVMGNQPSGDRVFQMRNLTGLTVQSLFLRPAVDGSRLDIQTTPGFRFNLNLLGPMGRGQGQASFTGVAVQPNLHAVVGADNWGNLATTTLLLQHTTQAGAVAQTTHLPRMK